MHKTLIGINCIDYSIGARRVYDIMSAAFPAATICFFPDDRQEKHLFPTGTNVLSMTNEDLLKRGLAIRGGAEISAGYAPTMPFITC